MFCPYCGNKIPDHVRFCPYCGRELRTDYIADKSASVPSTYRKSSGNRRKGEKRRHKAVRIVLICMLAGLIVLLVPVIIQTVQLARLRKQNGPYSPLNQYLGEDGSMGADAAARDHIAYDEDSYTVYYNERLQVYFASGTTDDEKNKAAESIDGTLVPPEDSESNLYGISLPEADLDTLQEKADSLKKMDTVIYAGIKAPSLQMEENSKVYQSHDPWTASGLDADDLGDEDNPGGPDWWAEAIGAYTAWQYDDKRQSVTIGVVDGGFDIDHDDFSSGIRMSEEYPDNFPDDHGTKVTGIIGAKGNNHIGLHGIADGAEIICGDYFYQKADVDYDDFHRKLWKAMIDEGAVAVNYSMNNTVDDFEDFATTTEAGKTKWDLLRVENDGIVVQVHPKEYKLKFSKDVKFYQYNGYFGIIAFSVSSKDFCDKIAELQKGDSTKTVEVYTENDDEGNIRSVILKDGQQPVMEYSLALFSGGDYQKYLEYEKTESRLDAIDDLLFLTDLLQQKSREDRKFILIQTAGNGYSNGGGNKGFDTVMEGNLCSIDESLFDDVFQNKRDQLGGLTWKDIDDHIIIVGAVKNQHPGNDKSEYSLTSWSNYGDNVDVFAPGADIFSTVTNSGYVKDITSTFGTSFAAPMVTASVGYLWSLNPDLTPGEVKALICENTGLTAVGVTGEDKGRKYPMLNLGKAVESLYSKSGAAAQKGYDDLKQVDIDGFEDIAYIADSGTYAGMDCQELTGYGPVWSGYYSDFGDNPYADGAQPDAHYDPNAIMVKKDGWYGVNDFDGNSLIDGLGGVASGDDEELRSYYRDIDWPVGYTQYGISLDDYKVLTCDYSSEKEDTDHKIYDLEGGDAGFMYVNEAGQVRSGVIGDVGAMWDGTLDLEPGTRAVLPIIDEAGGRQKVTGTAVVDSYGRELSVTTAIPRNIRGFTGFVNGFYQVAYYDNDYCLADEDHWEQKPRFYDLISADSGLITTEHYEDVKWFEDGLCPVKLHGKWAYINTDGQPVTDFIFDEASELYQGLAYVKLNGQYHIIRLHDAVPQDLSTMKKDSGGEDSSAETADQSGSRNDSQSSAQALLQQFLDNQIPAVYTADLFPDSSGSRYFQDMQAASDYPYNGESWVDLDNDGENELIISWDAAPIHQVYLDARNGAVYAMVDNAGFFYSFWTQFNGATWIGEGDTTHGNRQVYYLYHYQGGDNLVEQTSLGAYYTGQNYDAGSDFEYGDQTISMDEYEQLKAEIESNMKTAATNQ